MKTFLKNVLKKLVSKLLPIIEEQSTLPRLVSEIVWAEVFNNTIVGNSWSKDVSFSPGRAAVGYPCLYAMFRVLNEVKPKRILELGLGQSTKMIAQYAAHHSEVEHFVVEHDLEWIHFFERMYNLPNNSNIVQLPLEMIEYKDNDVRAFKGFYKTFSKQKFDFILIDAPFGGDMKQYSRIDVLQLLPDCLGKEFVIMVDDYNRVGERNMVAEIESKLHAAGIQYKLGEYNGEKTTVLICAKAQEFLTTM